MRGWIRALAAGVLCAALSATSGLAAPASGRKDFLRECSACHMAYPPALLPARSWQAITSTLTQHFGEDASLDKATTARITQFLVSHAADSRYGDPSILDGLPADVTPKRITDMPFWRDIHSDLLVPGVGVGPGIRTAANCVRCHGG